MLGLVVVRQQTLVTAGFAGALAFICGAILPVLVVVALPVYVMLPALAISTLAGLAGLGWLSAHLGGAPVGRAVARLVGWGVIALLATYLVGDMAGSVFL